MDPNSNTIHNAAPDPNLHSVQNQPPIIAQPKSKLRLYITIGILLPLLLVGGVFYFFYTYKTSDTLTVIPVETEHAATSTVSAMSEDVIFNFTPPLLAPSSEKKEMYFIGSVPGSEGEDPTLCKLSYQKIGGAVQTIWDQIDLQGVRSAKTLIPLNAWHISNADGDSAQLCSSRAVVTSGSDSVTVAAEDPKTGGVAHSITLSPHGIEMRARQTQLAIDYFGIPWFYRATKSDEDRIARKIVKIKQYFNVAYETRSLADYSSLVLTFEALPKKLEYVYPPTDEDDPPGTYGDSEKICVIGTPLRHAEQGRQCIEKIGTNAGGGSNYRIANLDMVWRDDEHCPKGKNTKGEVCKYYGQSIGMTMTLSDARYEFDSGTTSDNPFHVDPETQNVIFNLDLTKFLPPGASNPFKKEGAVAKLEGDLLPLVIEGIKLAQNHPEHRFDDYMPPHMCKTVGGDLQLPPCDVGETLENDGEYLRHFTFKNGQIGYEVTSLSDITYEVHKLSLVGTRRQ